MTERKHLTRDRPRNELKTALQFIRSKRCPKQYRATLKSVLLEAIEDEKRQREERARYRKSGKLWTKSDDRLIIETMKKTKNYSDAWAAQEELSRKLFRTIIAVRSRISKLNATPFFPYVPTEIPWTPPSPPEDKERPASVARRVDSTAGWPQLESGQECERDGWMYFLVADFRAKSDIERISYSGLAMEYCPPLMRIKKG